RRARRNEAFLPGVDLPDKLSFEASLPLAVEGAEFIVLAVPSKGFRQVATQLRDCRIPVVSVAKGIEHDTGLTMCGILAEAVPYAKRAALSGPTFAIEVARGIPTAIVGASPDSAMANEVQLLFSRPAFRVYTSTDSIGVELGGALKNVIAIAAGIG